MISRRRFIAIAATLPTLLQSCRPEEAMGQERVYLPVQERIDILNREIRRVQPMLRAVTPTWANPIHARETDGMFVFPELDYGLTIATVGYTVDLVGHRWHDYIGDIMFVEVDELFANAADQDIGAQVERTLLEAAQRFAEEAQ